MPMNAARRAETGMRRLTEIDEVHATATKDGGHRGSGRAHEQSRRTVTSSDGHRARSLLHHYCRRIAASVRRVKRPPAAYFCAADLPRTPGAT
jgi:hypothetical protein